MIDVPKLIAMSVPVLKGFKRIEPRDWGLDGTFLELMTEIGSLGRNLTIWENYRHGHRSRHNMADELSDILFVLVKLTVNMDIKCSRLEPRKIESPETAFFMLAELALTLRKEMGAESADTQVIRRHIEEMISLIGGFVDYYAISLEEAHQEEMRFASLWQRLFFTPEGRRIEHLVFLRKLVWGFAGWQHVRKMDR